MEPTPINTLDLFGVAAIITALGTPVALVLIAKLNRKVTHIDHAVNGKAPGAQSMVSQVADIHTVTKAGPIGPPRPVDPGDPGDPGE